LLVLVDTMGGWETMCVVCGGPLAAPNMEYLFHEQISEAEATCLRAQSFEGLEWLDDRLGITASEERIPLDLGGCSGYGIFETGDSTGRTFYSWTNFRAMALLSSGTNFRDIEDGLYGLICHTKCCELLERDLHYTLRFNDVWPMLMRQKGHNSWLECTDYGGMAEYIEQDFLFQCLYLDGGGWMLQDPTTHHENGERILKVWRAIIQSGFQLVKAEPADGASQAQNETLVEAAMDESQLQELC
jgi:hypothetical protein